MSHIQISLYPPIVDNLRETVTKVLSDDDTGYTSVVAPVVHPLYTRNFTDAALAQNHQAFSRSDLILEANEWHKKIIGKITDSINCDSADEAFRRHSEKTLIQEMAFCDHISTGATLIRLHVGPSLNLARTIIAHIKNIVYIEVPMVDPRSCAVLLHSADLAVPATNGDHENKAPPAPIASSDTWTWWNTFRMHADFDNRIYVCLEMSADVPSPDELKRWLGEPVGLLIIPAELFIRNSKNYPVLIRAHQAVLLAFLQHNVGFVIRANPKDGALYNYADYVRHLCGKNARVDPLRGYDDLIEYPLQPLFDNLDSYTYEVFEKDPIKYLNYQKAIELALADQVPESEIDQRTAIVMVVGAGRGPLVRAALNAAANTKRRMKLYVVEKNPNAIITLSALIQEMWSDKDMQLISTDMRDFKPPELVDILVSELLGSFGDNELSPECLDGAQKHLKPGTGISIPCKSTSYANPLMSSKIYNQLRTFERSSRPRDKPNSYAGYAETMYVIYLKNVYHIADPQPVFEFVHPNHERPIDNSRFKTLRFDVTQDAVLNGFAGYFDTILYGDVMLSTHPETHSRGMASWFPLYFPLTDPMQVRAGEQIELNVWRCLDQQRVWYEWSVSAPRITHIHNSKGRHYPINM